MHEVPFGAFIVEFVSENHSVTIAVFLDFRASTYEKSSSLKVLEGYYGGLVSFVVVSQDGYVGFWVWVWG